MFIDFSFFRRCCSASDEFVISPYPNKDNVKKQEGTNSSTDKSENENMEHAGPNELPVAFRSALAFWFLGLCNNYGYVVMLSAAVDIINSTTSSSAESHIAASNSTILNYDNQSARQCTEMSTGAILLADIIPSLIVKIIAPFFPLAIHFRMSAVIIANGLGFILVSQAKGIVMALVGVVTIAFASGLGEVSLLAYSAFYKNRRILSSWSSGTGAAGLFGAGSYMLVSYLSGKNHSQPLLIFLVVPALMGISFWILLERPFIARSTSYGDNIIDACQAASTMDTNTVEETEFIPDSPTLMDKLRAIPGLLNYMIPFALVYLFEYFINQGLHELIHFDYSWISTDTQYVSYQLAYQLGVFISRSSIGIIRVHQTWILTLLQGINVILFGTDAIYGYIPSIYVIWIAVLWEGCLGGLSYVNTYDRISLEVPAERREFSMGINSFGDAAGISLAGILAIPAHNWICSLPVYNQ